MSRNFRIGLDMTVLLTALERTPDAAARGATIGMRDVKDDWVRSARDVAPLDTGNLRRQISGKVEGSGLDASVEIEANAMNSRRFNYAYYIHEGGMADDGKSLRHPGTVEKFLDQPAEQNEARWQAMIEREIREQLEREGW